VSELVLNGVNVDDLGSILEDEGQE